MRSVSQLQDVLMKQVQLPASHRQIATWQHLVQLNVDVPIHLHVHSLVTPA